MTISVESAAKLRRFKRQLVMLMLSVATLILIGAAALAWQRHRLRSAYLDQPDGLQIYGKNAGHQVKRLVGTQMPRPDYAAEYRALFARLDAPALTASRWSQLRLDDPLWPQPWTPLDDALRADLRTCSAAHADILAEVDGLRDGYAAFITDYSDSRALDTAHWLPMRRLHRALCIRLMHHAAQQQPDAVMADIDTAIGLIRALDWDKPMAAYFVQADMREQLVRSVIWALPHAEIPDDRLIHLYNRLLNASRAESFQPGEYRQALHYEAAATTHLVAAQYGLCEDLRLPVIPPQTGDILHQPSRWERIAHKGYRELLHVDQAYQTLLADANMPYADAKQQGLRAKLRLQAHLDMAPGKDLVYPRFIMLFTDARERRMRDLTAQRMALIAILVERHRREHDGELPPTSADIADLVSGERPVAVNPRLNGFSLVHTPRGFAVVSGAGHMHPGPPHLGRRSTSPLSLDLEDGVWYLELALHPPTAPSPPPVMPDFQPLPKTADPKAE